jgi:histidinol-phosphate aminotransferase
MTFERPNIARMQGYKPGEQLDGGNIIKLNTNENPYPPAPAVTETLKSIDTAALRRYPPPTATLFRQAVAELHGIQPDNIIATNGGDELLRLALTTFVSPGATIVTTQPSYSLYPVLADIQGCDYQEIALNDDWSMPADFLARLEQSKASMCLLVNPHAPTGQLLSADYLESISQGFSGVLLVDEAYVDFVDEDQAYSAIELATRRDNVLLLRTLSKGYSLAGLRFGYGIGNRSLIEPMQFKTRDSYNTDLIAQQLATAAIQSQDYARDTWHRVRLERERLQSELTRLGFTVSPSQTNFLLATAPAGSDAEALYQGLKQRQILVRHFQQPRLEDKLRISIGTPEENSQLLAALADLL